MRMAKSVWPLIALSLFFVATTALWITLNHAPPQWDDAWYLTNSLVMFDALGEGGLPAYTAKFLTILRIKAPLITVLPTPVYLVLGRRARAALLVNLVAMLTLFALLYEIARRFGSRRTGLIAVYVAGTMPLLYGLSHWFLIEYSLAALVCLTIYLAIEALEKPRAPVFLLLGVTCGLGALLKISFPLYVLLPLLYLLVQEWLESRWSSRLFFIFLVPAVLLPLPWYAANFREAISRAVLSASPKGDSVVYGAFSPAAFKFFVPGVINAGVSAYYFLLAGALLLFVCLSGKFRDWWRQWPRGTRRVLVLWSLSFLVFLFGGNKDLRYVAPVLPVFALFLASLVDHFLMQMERWRPAVAALLLVFPLVAFLHNSFGVLGDLRLAVGGFIFTDRQLHFAGTYDTRGWPHREILERIVHFSAVHAGEKKAVMIGTDLAQFNANNFELAAVRYRLPLRIVGSAYEEDLPSLFAQLHSVSYFVYKEGGEEESGSSNSYRKALLEKVHDRATFHEIPCRIPLPDGGSTRVFENLSPLESSALIRTGATRVDPYQFDFGGQIQLTGFAFEQDRTSLRVHLRWQCVRPPDRDYMSFIHILDTGGKVAGQLDHVLLSGNPPVLSWQPGDVALENLVFPLASNQRALTHHLRLGLYDLKSGDRLQAKIVAGGRGFSLADGETAVLTPEASHLVR